MAIGTGTDSTYPGARDVRVAYFGPLPSGSRPHLHAVLHRYQQHALAGPTWWRWASISRVIDTGLKLRARCQGARVRRDGTALGARFDLCPGTWTVAAWQKPVPWTASHRRRIRDGQSHTAADALPDGPNLAFEGS